MSFPQGFSKQKNRLQPSYITRQRFRKKTGAIFYGSRVFSAVDFSALLGGYEASRLPSEWWQNSLTAMSLHPPRIEWTFERCFFDDIGNCSNHSGTLITHDEIKLPPDGYLDIKPDALNYGTGDCRNMKDFMDKYPAKTKPPKSYER